MRWIRLAGWKALVFGVLAALFGGLLLGTAFILSGFYNVAASARHFDITNAIIRLTLRRSVATRSIGMEPPENLSDEALARLGARHFELGCAPCHGSPASPQNPVVAEMYPSPPQLSRAVDHWQTEELHWIVQHGLKFTGMPAWPALGREDEVWALVAFLERLPGMNATEYAEWAGIGAGPAASGFAFGPETNANNVVAACNNCHGGTEGPPVHPLVPAISGQKQDYIQRALVEYAENRRPSGIMRPIASEMDAAAIEELSRFYADADPAQPLSQTNWDPEAIRRGEEIAQRGLRADDLPACRSCHAEGSSNEFPRLDGLSAEYIATQLRLFRDGVRGASTYAAIMAPIARRLSQQQIEDVAAYFASRSRAADESTASEAMQ